MNWQNQHLQNVEDEGFNSFDRTHTQASTNSGLPEHMGTRGIYEDMTVGIFTQFVSKHALDPFKSGGGVGRIMLTLFENVPPRLALL